MSLLTLADLLEALTGTRPAHANLVITEAATDSRQVIPGGLFVALPGERVDGHDYLDAAFSNGASIALVQTDQSTRCTQFTPAELVTKPVSQQDLPLCILVPDTLAALQTVARFWRGKLTLKTIGITGSIGKSTTKELAADVLAQHYATARNYGNLNNEIGLPISLLRLGNGFDRAILEMGFYVPGEIAFLCELAKPEIGIVTNVTPVHAERAGSLEVIAAGKAELVQALPAHGWAILNHDDPLVRAMSEKTAAKVFYYGTTPDADLWADEIVGLGINGLKFKLHHRSDVIDMQVPMVGKHSIMTILRSVALAIVEGLTWREISDGLKFSRSQLRLVVVHLKNGATLLDDSYNSSPDSCVAALDLLSEMPGRKVAILGDMLELGSYEVEGHERVGKKAAESANALIAIGNRARTFVVAAVAHGLPESQTYWFADVPAAIPFIRDYLVEGDTALVKGSLGMGMARIVVALETKS